MAEEFQIWQYINKSLTKIKVKLKIYLSKMYIHNKWNADVNLIDTFSDEISACTVLGIFHGNKKSKIYSESTTCTCN